MIINMDLDAAKLGLALSLDWYRYILHSTPHVHHSSPLKGHVSHIKLSIDYSICRLIVLILLLLLLMYVITMVLHV